MAQVSSVIMLAVLLPSLLQQNPGTFQRALFHYHTSQYSDEGGEGKENNDYSSSHYTACLYQSQHRQFTSIESSQVLCWAVTSPSRGWAGGEIQNGIYLDFLVTIWTKRDPRFVWEQWWLARSNISEEKNDLQKHTFKSRRANAQVAIIPIHQT